MDRGRIAGLLGTNRHHHRQALLQSVAIKVIPAAAAVIIAISVGSAWFAGKSGSICRKVIVMARKNERGRIIVSTK
jgi:hypothetical protein